jgi:acetyl esterase/lipase
MRLLSLITYLSAAASAFLLARPKNPPASVLLWLPRAYAQALAPVFAFIGFASALAGLFRRDWKLAAAGAVGAGVSAGYLHTVSAYHNAFAAAFGDDWEDRLPQDLRPFTPFRRWRAPRWRPLRVGLPAARRQADIAYGENPDGVQLLADLWQPGEDAARSGMGVIYIHGGAWQRGNKDMGTRTFFRRLAGQGHVVMDIAYTLGEGTPLAVMVGDVKRAILWFKAHAAELGVDPERIVLIGGSAGAHLALVSAYTPNHPAFRPGPDDGDTSVRAVVAYYPPTDLEGMYEKTQTAYGHLLEAPQQELRFKDKALFTTFDALGFLPNRPNGGRNNYIAHLLGGSPDDTPDAYALLSPIRLLGSHCPPTLLLQGTEDFFQFTPTVRQLYADLQTAGIPSVLIEYPHADHAFDLVLPQISPVAQAAIYDVERFLALIGA